MLFTLGSIRELVSPFVLTGGSCPDSVTVKNRVNEAIRRLLSEGRADWDQTQRRVRLFVSNGLITLPREFESARVIAVDRKPVTILPTHYHYIESGPGVEMAGEHYGGVDIMDAGSGWPTFFDIPDSENGSGYYLFAASTAATDADLTMLVQARGTNGAQILQTSGAPGIVLPVTVWSGAEGVLSGLPAAPYLSSLAVTHIDSVSLPANQKGYISFYAVNPTTHEMFFLSKYHPDEVVPGYRRYGILSPASDDPVRAVDMLCKVRYIPATRDEDVLLIQNPDAIKTMVMAIREENAGNIQVSVALEEKANGQLARQLTNTRSADPILRVREDFGMGSIPQIF